MAHISNTMSTRGLPDMYTLSPRALGVHIRQTTRVHGITIPYTHIRVSRHNRMKHAMACITETSASILS